MLPCEGQNPWPTPLLWALRGGTSEGGAPPPGREAGDRPAAPAETDVLSPPPEVCHLLPWLPGAASGVTVGAWLPREARWAGHGGPARPRPAPPRRDPGFPLLSRLPRTCGPGAEAAALGRPPRPWVQLAGFATIATNTPVPSTDCGVTPQCPAGRPARAGAGSWS